MFTIFFLGVVRIPGTIIDNRLVNSAERPFITMNPILVTAHCNKVVLVAWAYGSVIQSTAAVAVRIENAVGFHRANESDIFFKRIIPNGFTGIPAIYLKNDVGVCLRQRIKELDRHIDFGAALRTAAAQAIAQGKITCADIGTKHLIPEHLFTLQMRIVPACTLHGPYSPRGWFLLFDDCVIYAQVDRFTFCQSYFGYFSQRFCLLLLGHLLLIPFTFT